MNEQSAENDMAIAIRYLALELPSAVHDDVVARWPSLCNEIERLKARLAECERLRAVAEQDADGLALARLTGCICNHRLPAGFDYLPDGFTLGPMCHAHERHAVAVEERPVTEGT